jgi:hypothetical protein
VAADLVKEVQVVGHEHHGTAGQETQDAVLEDVARHLRRQIDRILSSLTTWTASES